MASAIGPTPPPPSAWKSSPRGSGGSATPLDAAQATSSASDQITRAQQQVQSAQSDANSQLENIRNGFAQEEESQNSQNETALEKERLKGYEQLAALKRAQEVELKRVKREGEKDLKQAGDYYRDGLYQAMRKGDQDLKGLQAKQGREQQYIATTGQSQSELEKESESQKLAALRSADEQRLTDLSGASHAEYDRMKTNTDLSVKQENERFQQQYQAAFQENEGALDTLNSVAGSEIRQIRQDTAQKLAAYSSRQSDPFYKMMDMGATLRDEGDRYVLTAKIPTQEQQHIAVSLRGNALFLSGTRRNEEHLDLSPGHSKGTSSYQSFEESFPLATPVDRDLLTKEFRGDTVIITVPKSTQLFHEGYQAKPEPARVRAERPHFPGNLPYSENPTETASSPAPSPRAPGSKPLA